MEGLDGIPTQSFYLNSLPHLLAAAESRELQLNASVEARSFLPEEILLVYSFYFI